MTINAEPINALKAMIDLLRADTVIAAEVGSIRVYGHTLPAAITGEIDSEWAKHMPRPMVLVREAGGLEKTGVGPLSWPRFDVRCYGKEPGGIWEASNLSRIIFDQLFGQGMVRKEPGKRVPMADPMAGPDDPGYSVKGLVAITLNAGPTSGREPDTGWAYNLRTYDVLQGG